MGQWEDNFSAIASVALGVGQGLRAHQQRFIESPNVLSEALKRWDIEITGAVQGAFPQLPVIGIGQERQFQVSHLDAFVVYSALAGRHRYLQGATDFGVTIGLVANGEPVNGLCIFPGHEAAFYTHGNNSYACRLEPDGSFPADWLSGENVIGVKADRNPRLNVMISGAANDKYISTLNAEKNFCNNGAFALCAAATGYSYDAAACIGTMGFGFHSAGAHAVLNKAGGVLIRDKAGKMLSYREFFKMVNVFGGSAGNAALLKDLYYKNLFQPGHRHDLG